MSVNKYDASTGTLTTIANGQRTWVGTKAAYEAAKTAGTLPTNALVAITDDSRDNSYSTDEVLTGKFWIDGKPIYRKVFETTTPATADTDTVLMKIADDVESIVDLSGFLYYSTNPTQIEPINWSYSGTQPYMTTYVREDNDGELHIRQKASGGRNNKSEYIIVEYTKTTD